MAEEYDDCPECGTAHGLAYAKPVRCDACCGAGAREGGRSHTHVSIPEVCGVLGGRSHSPFSRALREARERIRGLTGRKLSVESGRGADWIGNLERGNQPPPDRVACADLERRLRLEPDTLWHLAARERCPPDVLAWHQEQLQAGTERAAIVAWLEREADLSPDVRVCDSPRAVALAITAGVHHGPPPSPRCLCGDDWVATLPNGACRCWACFVVEIVHFANEDRSACELRKVGT